MRRLRIEVSELLKGQYQNVQTHQEGSDVSNATTGRHNRDIRARQNIAILGVTYTEEPRKIPQTGQLDE